VKALDDPAPEVQRAAAESLRRIGGPAVGALLDAARSAGASPRPIEVLSKIGSAAVRELAAALRSEDPKVRETAAETFGRMGQGGLDALPLLIEATKVRDPNVRAACARAIGMMAPHSAAAIPALLAIANDKQRVVRLAVIVSLGQLRATEAMPVLTSAMRDDDVDIRNAAANSRRLIEGR
jgi:HEAT repeat protein